MSANQMQFKHRLWVAVLAGLVGAPAIQAAVQARLSQNPVYAGDTLTLTLSSDAPSNGAQPDLAPLKRDFEVLGTAASSQLSVVNGRSSALTEWRVQLLPRHSGVLMVPALQLGAERSRPLSVTVADTPSPAVATEAAAIAQHLFIEASVDPTAGTPYVQQQVLFTVRLYYDDSVRNGELGELQIADAMIERVGEDTLSSATRNGRLYQVLERHYAIFPQKSGVLEIPAVRFEGRMVGKDVGGGVQPRGGSPMQHFLQDSPFANDPFFRRGVFQSGTFGRILGDPGRSVRIAGSALQVKVRPHPVTQGAWLPARGVRLHDSWTDAAPHLRIGEPVSRTVTIEADGLSGSQIPALDLPTSKQLQQYRESAESVTHSDGDRLVGVSRQTLTYLPNAAGPLAVPALTLAWWNTTQDKAASVQLPSWQLAVQARAGGPAAQVPPAAAVSAARPVWRELMAAHWAWLAAGIVTLTGVVVWRVVRRRRHAAAFDAAKMSAVAAPSVLASPARTLDRHLYGVGVGDWPPHEGVLS